MSPPTMQDTPSHRRQEERRDHQVRTDTLVRYAHELLGTSGVDRSPSWVSRAVRAYEQHGLGRVTFGTWLSDRLDLSSVQRDRAAVRYLLSYADPTGEAAVRNVMKGRGA